MGKECTGLRPSAESLFRPTYVKASKVCQLDSVTVGHPRWTVDLSRAELRYRLQPERGGEVTVVKVRF